MHQNGSLAPCEIIFTKFSETLPQSFWYGHNCKLTKKSKPDNFLSYLNNQAKICSYVLA